jgi:sugar lactone lactonase YvrE
VRSLPTGTITVTPTSRNAANLLGSQPLVANGLQFDRRGNLYVADTARGAIWKVRFHNNGTVASSMGCDTTFPPNTLCLDNVMAAHPYLEGADGIVLDVAGDIWVSANERNAIVFVWSNSASVVEVFRNPTDAATQLRNVGPLESPTSPVLVGHKLCTANSDGNRRDNSPSTAGEIGGPGQPRGKISCLDQRATIPGASLPVR